VRADNWKLLVHADGSGAELYDLASDPREERNLAEATPNVTERLSDQALGWRATLP